MFPEIKFVMVFLISLVFVAFGAELFSSYLDHLMLMEELRLSHSLMVCP